MRAGLISWTLDERLQTPMRFLVEADRRICRQRAIIRSLDAAGHPTTKAETVLALMIDTRDIIHREIDCFAEAVQDRLS